MISGRSAHSLVAAFHRDMPACVAPAPTPPSRLPSLPPSLPPRQDLLGLGDRVHDVSPYVTSPCGQALLACPTASRASPDFMVLRWAHAVVRWFLFTDSRFLRCGSMQLWALQLARHPPALLAHEAQLTQPLPPIPRSNDTALEEAIGGYVDGMLVSEPYTFPASFVISAAQDPGARPPALASQAPPPQPCMLWQLLR